ncbi:DUF4350 domain-containing protein [Planktothrix sp. FACHB-1355]|uniref:DUF4350 domain-containing protein n=1 Tax=Aerosakkonema funiforme FACHB-1375 TaxID=2949571 RepID=A0A926ZH17_9CYAN|nr:MULTISPECIES: DUF4350 domain-containing protein [Oscillatoriales]MBD2180426.1 DUF4350 domain-containing protein [Aerosakkonema funiforme FACHB-1375]MBD3561183.1 DUF4350 domain-containing protein [Planktothrix sp. FACHB-1355]
MKLTQRYLWLAALTVAVIILLTLMAAPLATKLSSGSTYSRAPDGYGAWYAFMAKRGTPIERWQKADLPGVSLQKSQSKIQNPKSKIQNSITLLRVHNQLDYDSLYYREREWVEAGNKLVMLGVRQPVTEANFSTVPESQTGKVKIETRRRRQLQAKEEIRLADRFGAIVWEQKLGKGKIIYATTPHLAANAYQDEPGNYQFLAQLVSEGSKSIFVDEYIHGYKDKEEIVAEGKGSWITYLAKTPLVSIFVQAGVILLVLVLANNRRLGQPITLASPTVDNSEAYIQALAGVLQKANSSEFVVEAIGKEEQIQLQKALGLGTTPIDRESLINAWVQQTGRPAAELEQVLELQSTKRRISEQELLSWLGKWQRVNQL